MFGFPPVLEQGNRKTKRPPRKKAPKKKVDDDKEGPKTFQISALLGLDKRAWKTKTREKEKPKKKSGN